MPYDKAMNLDFSDDEIQRYSRHILLEDVGGTGQAKLREARVLIVGAGGLGSPLALYLAAAGVGRIGLVDDDDVDLSNLQRQIAHTTASIGTPKVASAAERALAINPHVAIEQHRLRLDRTTILPLIAQYDIICDGTDNFGTRFLISDATVLARKTLADGGPCPCYRCLDPEPPPPGMVPSCSEAGVLGAVTGVMGTLQATEVLKEILGIGETLAGRLLIWDALATRFRTVKLRADPGCAACGSTPSIHDLSAHTDTAGPLCAL